MRVLVCGSRDWCDQKVIDIVLTGLLHSYKYLEVGEGCAAGADRCGEVFCKAHGVPNRHFPADWARNGPAAGPIRNQQMLDEFNPNVVFAFKDGFNAKPGRGGTEDMVRRSRGAGVPTFVVSHGEEV